MEEEDPASITTPPDRSDDPDPVGEASGTSEEKKDSEQGDDPASPSDSLDPLEPPGTPEGMTVSEHEDSVNATPPDCSNTVDILEACERIERMETTESPDMDTVPPESSDPVVPSKSNSKDAMEMEPSNQSDSLDPSDLPEKTPESADPLALESSDPPENTAEPSDPLEISAPLEDTAAPPDPSDSLKPSDADPLGPSEPSGPVKKKKGRGRPSGLAWYGKKGKEDSANSVVRTTKRKKAKKLGRPFGSKNSDKPGPVSGRKGRGKKRKPPGRKPATPPKIINNKRASTAGTSELPYQIIVPPIPGTASRKTISVASSVKPYQIIVPPPPYPSGSLQKNIPLPLNNLLPKPLPPKPNLNLKICLICLRRYDDSEKCSSEPQEEIEVIEVIDKTPSKDPLLDAVVKANFTSAMKVKEMERKEKRLNVYFRFLKIVSRYLQIKTKRFRKSIDKDDNPPFCNDCFHFIENFCDVYCEWDVAKISIQWRLTQIAEAVKLSKSGKLGASLLKSLSTQLHLVNSKVVDHFRKQLSIKCNGSLSSVIAKTVRDGPRVSVDKNGCKKYAESQLKFPIEQMVGYLKSLIVVFALAVPHKEVVKPKIKSHKKGTKGVTKTKSSPVVVKEEVIEGQEAATDNTVDPDQFGGGDDGGGYSPPPSPAGPSSPIRAEEEDEDDKQDNEEEDGLRGSDTDWSGNDSTVEFSVQPTITRRWNLRKRRSTRKADGENDPNNVDNDDDFALELPPLRSARPKHVVNEADKKFPCNICNLRFFTDGALKRHLSQKHEFILPYNCKHCPQRFRLRKFLDAHMKKAHPTMKTDNSLAAIASTCSTCQKVFPSKTKLFLHRRQAHKANLGNFTCETCGKVVRGKFRYDRHVKSHTRTERSFPCTHPSCRRRFFTEDGLNSHRKFHEENPDWQPAKKKRQGNASNTLNLNLGPYKCEVPDCGRAFYREPNLKTHMALHAASFTCSTCEKVFLSFRDIRSHLVRAHETTQKTIHCPYCDKGFTLKQTYDFHMKVSHPSQTKFSCDVDLCEGEFDTVDDLREHLKAAHLAPEVVEIVEKVDGGGIFCFSKKTEEMDVNATVANTTTPSDGSSVTASTETNPVSEPNPTTASVSEPDAPPCSEGDSAAAAVTDVVSLGVNLMKQPTATKFKIDGPEIFVQGLFTCEKCRWSFSTRFALSIHLILHTKRDRKGQFGCKLCSKAFVVVDTLQTHYNSAHGPNIKLILCKICGQRFHRRESYMGHMKVHQDDSSEDKSYLCADCGMSCENRFAYHRHMRTHKNKPTRSFSSPKEPSQRKRRRIQEGVTNVIRKKRSARSEPLILQCDQCAETFPNQLKLSIHETNVHGKERPLKCDTEGCSKSFFKRENLKRHQLTHGEHSFLCPHCPKAFYCQQNLDRHIAVHNDEKNHMCHICGKGFVNQSGLKTHLTIHSEVKNHKCSYCDKAFVRKQVLICHERTHTNEKPFPCRVCGEKFSQYSARKNHELRHKKLNSDQKLPMRGRRRQLAKLEESENKAKERPTRGSKRKGKSKERCIKSESSDEEADTGMEQPVPTSSASGIIHEALKAAFSDGSEIPHFGDVFNPARVKDEVRPGVGKQDLLNSIEVVVQYNDNDEEETDVSQQGRTRKGRPPKTQEKTTYTNNLTCGFCGKAFQRQRAYTAHVEQHLNVDSVLGEGSSNETQMDKKRNQQSHTNASSVNNQQAQHQHHSPAPEPARIGLSTLTRRQSRLAALAVAPSPPEPVVAPEPPSKKRKGRPPGKGNKSKSEPPGKRLARIVEDVMEAATSAQYFNNTRTSTPPQTQSPSQLYQQHSTHQVMQSPSPHQHQYQSSPSPHQTMQSGSERSTPTASPAPNQNHHHQQVTSGEATSTFPSTFISPYLLPNAYALPRQESSQQQVGMFLNQQGANAQQQHQNQQQPNLHPNYTQYHQYLLQHQNSGNPAGPQDLSKSSYPMFFANPR